MELHAFPLVAIILAIATAAGLLAVRLRQPLIVAFIGVGILVGPVAPAGSTPTAPSSCWPGWASPSCCSSSGCAWTCT
jgi:Kef-type K+ transport system membrane component KefB